MSVKDGSVSNFAEYISTMLVIVMTFLSIVVPHHFHVFMCTCLFKLYSLLFSVKCQNKQPKME